MFIMISFGDLACYCGVDVSSKSAVEGWSLPWRLGPRTPAGPVSALVEPRPNNKKTVRYSEQPYR